MLETQGTFGQLVVMEILRYCILGNVRGKQSLIIS